MFGFGKKPESALPQLVESTVREVGPNGLGPLDYLFDAKKIPVMVMARLRAETWPIMTYIGGLAIHQKVKGEERAIDLECQYMAQLHRRLGEASTGMTTADWLAFNMNRHLKFSKKREGGDPLIFAFRHVVLAEVATSPKDDVLSYQRDELGDDLMKLLYADRHAMAWIGEVHSRFIALF